MIAARTIAMSMVTTAQPQTSVPRHQRVGELACRRCRDSHAACRRRHPIPPIVPILLLSLVPLLRLLHSLLLFRARGWQGRPRRHRGRRSHIDRLAKPDQFDTHVRPFVLHESAQHRASLLLQHFLRPPRVPRESRQRLVHLTVGLAKSQMPELRNSAREMSARNGSIFIMRLTIFSNRVLEIGSMWRAVAGGCGWESLFIPC